MFDWVLFWTKNQLLALCCWKQRQKGFPKTFRPEADQDWECIGKIYWAVLVLDSVFWYCSEFGKFRQLVHCAHNFWTPQKCTIFKNYNTFAKLFWGTLAGAGVFIEHNSDIFHIFLCFRCAHIFHFDHLWIMIEDSFTPIPSDCCHFPLVIVLLVLSLVVLSPSLSILNVFYLLFCLLEEMGRKQCFGQSKFSCVSVFLLKQLKRKEEIQSLGKVTV